MASDYAPGLNEAAPGTVSAAGTPVDVPPAPGGHTRQEHGLPEAGLAEHAMAEHDSLNRAGAQHHSAGSAGRQFAGVAEVAARIAGNIELVIEGKPDVVRLGITVLLAEGHLLIEDVPGVGKTKFAKALARSIDCSVRRIQFTPDLLPSDVTGVSIYAADRGEFEFKPGAVFANIVVGDEINRASPKTQSALLESMEERQVTVDTETFFLETPFMVLATQNPIDMEGTYPLPEAQRDRFTARMSMGYPDRSAEMAMLSEQDHVDPLDDLKPVSDAAEIGDAIAAARRVHVADAVKGYVVDLANATRTSPEIALGASPRAVLQLIRAAKAWAAIDGRDFVVPDDVQHLVTPVLAHRLILTSEAQLSRADVRGVLQRIVATVAVPRATAALSQIATPAQGENRPGSRGAFSLGRR